MAKKYTAPGSKCMSSAHMPKSQGKMSGAQGCTSHNPTKGMYNAAGRVGAGTRAFKNTMTKETGK